MVYNKQNIAQKIEKSLEHEIDVNFKLNFYSFMLHCYTLCMDEGKSKNSSLIINLSFSPSLSLSFISVYSCLTIQIVTQKRKSFLKIIVQKLFKKKENNKL